MLYPTTLTLVSCVEPAISVELQCPRVELFFHVSNEDLGFFWLPTQYAVEERRCDGINSLQHLSLKEDPNGLHSFVGVPRADRGLYRQISSKY